jgi:hypothetical protein
VRPADLEEAVAQHLLDPDLGRSPPHDRAAGDSLRFLGERLLDELLQMTHCATDSSDLGRRRQRVPAQIDHVAEINAASDAEQRRSSRELGNGAGSDDQR